MRAEIDGEIYDTDTAQKIAYFTKEFGSDEFRHVEETLYRTKGGRFFLAGGGGAMTHYSHPEGDKQIGGSGIFPLTAREAKKWCNTHGVDQKSIAQYFNP